MKQVNIYRFRKYDVSRDEFQISSRWGTREAIVKNVRGEVLEDTETEVDEGVVDSDGLTPHRFDPHATRGFPRAK